MRDQYFHWYWSLIGQYPSPLVAVTFTEILVIILVTVKYLVVTCGQYEVVDVGHTKTIARSWKFSSQDPGGSSLFQQLCGGQVVTSSDEECLKHDGWHHHNYYQHLPWFPHHYQSNYSHEYICPVVAEGDLSQWGQPRSTRLLQCGILFLQSLERLLEGWWHRLDYNRDVNYNEYNSPHITG